jgi:hypothetical protein
VGRCDLSRNGQPQDGDRDGPHDAPSSHDPPSFHGPAPHAGRAGFEASLNIE